MSTADQFRTTIDRREAIKRVSALLGGAAFVGGNALLTACAQDRAAPSASAGATIGAFTPSDVAYLDDIADTILPDTEKSPGAKAAGVGAFMALMITDCYEPKDQQIVRTGLTQLDEACRAANGSTFALATPAQRLALLEQVDRDAKQYMDTRTTEQPTHYFRMLKELALLGYFTSEIGCTKAQRYTETPGRFDPCVPHAAGDTSWAAHA